MGGRAGSAGRSRTAAASPAPRPGRRAARAGARTSGAPARPPITDSGPAGRRTYEEMAEAVGRLFGARTEDGAPQCMFGTLCPASLEVGGRKLRIEYVDMDGAPYTINARGPSVLLVVNRGSRLFSEAANPLRLVALAVAEAAAACEAGGGAADFLDKRSRAWARAADGSIAAERPPNEPPPPPPRRLAGTADGYRLSWRLEDLGGYLERRYEFVFEFSGLSTLESHMHNVLGTPFYSLYTEKGQGGYLRDLVLERDEILVPVVAPDGGSIGALLDACRGRPFVAIREYARNTLRRGLAPPAKAWMDLLREVRRHRMPILNEDVGATLWSLSKRGLVSRSGLEAMARRRGRMADIGEFADEAFG